MSASGCEIWAPTQNPQRVQKESAKLLGLLYHAGGVSRLVRNDMYRGSTPASYYESLDWIFTPPDYVREFRR